MTDKNKMAAIGHQLLIQKRKKSKKCNKSKNSKRVGHHWAPSISTKAQKEQKLKNTKRAKNALACQLLVLST